MHGSNPPPRQVRFAFYEADFTAGELRKNGIRVKIQAKPFAILAALIERPGELVTREELYKALWPDETFVDFEKNLSVAVNKLREALCDSPNEPRYIETVPRRGYRFLAKIERAEPIPPPASPVPEEKTGARQVPRRVLLLVLSCVAVVLIAIQVVRLYPGKSANPLAAVKASIAVLPFADMSSSKDQEYLSEGISEELISRLSQRPGLNITGRSSAFQFKGKIEDLREIGRKLGVAYVLEGSVRKQGPRVRITAELIKTDTGFSVWSQSFERDVGDTFRVEDEIGAAVTAALPSKVLGREATTAPANSHTIDPEAHEAYLYGRYFWNRRTEQGFDTAIEYFNRAIARDPNYAAAYAGLADSYLLLGELQMRPHEEVFPKARAAAETAMKLDPALAEPHASLGALYVDQGQLQNGEHEYQRAIQLNPGYATAHQWYAEFLGGSGRSKEALAEIRRARELDPLSLVVNTQVGWILYLARRNDEAIGTFRKVIEMDPRFDIAHGDLGMAYEVKGMYREAISEYRIASDLGGRRTQRLSDIARATALAGDKQEARRLRALLEEPARRKEVGVLDFVLLDIALGESDRAVSRLEKEVKRQQHPFGPLPLGPEYDALRSLPYAQFFTTVDPLRAAR